VANTTALSDKPSRILLATDLSARGDRALERAITIAKRWHAQLFILYVFEEIGDDAPTGASHIPSWPGPRDAVEIAKHRIRRGLRMDLGDAVQNATVLIEEGKPIDVIERVAMTRDIELILTGVAREGLFAHRPVTLGVTVERLLRRSPVPLLIVRNRARAPYQHIVVAVDFSDASAEALRAALRFFPTQSFHLLHAFDIPYLSFMEDEERCAAEYRNGHMRDLDAFLDSLMLEEGDRRRLIPLIQRGQPERLLCEHVLAHDADLVVMGTHGRGVVYEALLGSTAKGILASLPCDALVVPSRRRRWMEPDAAMPAA
jgi:nucleotide-binding universal stress UspA family protein